MHETGQWLVLFVAFVLLLVDGHRLNSVSRRLDKLEQDDSDDAG